jgi:predicted branched-subunit amino acid permease
MQATDTSYSQGLIAGLPIVLGYFPIAFAFGVAATGQGLSPLEAFALSLIIYAGAAQFLAKNRVVNRVGTGNASCHKSRQLCKVFDWCRLCSGSRFAGQTW